MTRLAQLIAQQEGFFIAGSVPQRRNNPGDLRHGNHCQHSTAATLVLDPVTGLPINPNDIGLIDTIEHGWQDLERQLMLIAGRLISVDPITHEPVSPPRKSTLSDCVYIWAPPTENNSSAYLDFIIAGFGGVVDAGSLLADVLQIMNGPAIVT